MGNVTKTRILIVIVIIIIAVLTFIAIRQTLEVHHFQERLGHDYASEIRSLEFNLVEEQIDLWFDKVEQGDYREVSNDINYFQYKVKLVPRNAGEVPYMNLLKINNLFRDYDEGDSEKEIRREYEFLQNLLADLEEHVTERLETDRGTRELYHELNDSDSELNRELQNRFNEHIQSSENQ
ncbi:hypothetical protein [Aquisalibacillus elongatus]|uniref:Uncharacterized protein n=1 Tax=Aquisalibacillus elongatus TaxID=485577 RepID=A0A3N5BZ01_9BACI|nr:hypothetical protein [Aquisalibacillus elongatus]RPF51085.1 hypothetical protein EDC24_2350 [Aquisalibacillus elongatus]